MNPLVRKFVEQSQRYASLDGETWYRVLPWTDVQPGSYCVDYNGIPEFFVEDARWAFGHPVFLGNGAPPSALIA